MNIVVIGGGIAGLSAAWALSHPQQMRDPKSRALNPQVTVLEASQRLGGKIHTTEFGGSLIEEGADAFLSRVPWAVQLCQELGLQSELISPQENRAWLWNKDRLEQFPTNTLLGVPSGIKSLRQTRSISKLAKLRALADYLLPTSEFTGADPSISEVLARRFGAEIVDTLVDPLIGGINAGSVKNLSLSSAAPQLADIATLNRSVMKGVKNYLSKHNSNLPMFYSINGGLSTLINALDKQLSERGANINLNTQVENLIQQPDKRWVVKTANKTLVADAVVVAVPAYQAADLLHYVDPKISELLSKIRYASVGIIRLAYDSREVPGRLQGAGFVVPSKEKTMLSACSWTSSKWANITKSSQVILRASVGRIDDQRFQNFSDHQLIDIVHHEIAKAVNIYRKPVESDVIRWPNSFPQYESGHKKLIEEIQNALTSRGGIALAGAAYHGLGIPACIRSGSLAGEKVLQEIENVY